MAGAAANAALTPGRLRLGVNIDHVATIRNARGGDHPDPVRAAEIVAAVGGDGITAHLREDRRHIRDEDLARIQAATDLPLNLEMAATEEMLEIALRHRPHAACIVPERREERTTEGGLDAAGQHNRLAPIVARLSDAGIASACSSRPKRGRSRRRSGWAPRWWNCTPANTPMRQAKRARSNLSESPTWPRWRRATASNRTPGTG
jgi:hypothetical protein